MKQYKVILANMLTWKKRFLFVLIAGLSLETAFARTQTGRAASGRNDCLFAMARAHDQAVDDCSDDDKYFVLSGYSRCDKGRLWVSSTVTYICVDAYSKLETKEPKTRENLLAEFDATTDPKKRAEIRADLFLLNKNQPMQSANLSTQSSSAAQ